MEKITVLTEAQKACFKEWIDKWIQIGLSTGRLFAIPVPPDVKTALEANSWTYSINPNQLNPEVRT